MKLIDAAQTASLLPFEKLIPALQKAFAQGCTVPERHHHHIDIPNEAEATLLLMPAWHHAAQAARYLGIKIVTVHPGNTLRGIAGLTSTYMLYDAATGAHLAIIDGNVITARRTVAASALAASFLSRPDSRRLLILGAGRVGSLLPDAYRAVRPIEHVDFWDDIMPSNAETLVKRLSSDGISASVAPDLEAAIAKADIVSAATLSTQPLIRGAWLRPGTHVDLIGGFKPDMREADDDAITRASVYIDTTEALHEAGDLVQPVAAGIFSNSRVLTTLESLCQTGTSARRSKEEITLYKAVGTALADLAAATLVYENCPDR